MFLPLGKEHAKHAEGFAPLPTALVCFSLIVGDIKKDAKRKLRIVLSMAEPNPEPPSHALLLLGLTSAETRSSFTPSLKNERIK